MAVAAWPGSVNQFVKRDGYGETPERNVVSFAPDVGPPIERKRSAISTTVLSGEGRGTRTEWDALVTFYKTTLNDGVDSFTRLHPDTGASITCRFTEPPKLTRRGALYCHYSLALRVMP